MRKDAFAGLKRPWFAGGTVNFASVQARAHVLAPNEGAFEDGTVNYLSIPAVEMGLKHTAAIGVDNIKERVTCLTAWLLDQLVGMRHSNGRPMARIYGPITTESRGATITMNFYDPAGRLLDYRRIEELANDAGISVRTGCFCNPGAGEMAESLTAEDMKATTELGREISLPRLLKLMQEKGSSKSMGALRASFGIASNFRDAWRFLEFARGLRDQSPLTLGEVTFDIDSCRVIRDGA
jgi:selenocysteine lyase/cysteine desulfurase